MQTEIERMADFAAGLSLDTVPKRVVRKARWQLLSTLGAIHASARHELGRLAISAVDTLAGEGRCSLIPTGRKVDLLSAVYVAAALSLALDYDDYLLFGHSGHSAVCAPLLVGESVGAPLQKVLEAQIVANEIAGRLGAAVILGPHNGQAWSHIHLAAAAAATARLLGLPRTTIAHAIAIAMYQPNYALWPGFMGPDSKVTTAATPTVTGVRAAFLAAGGATGALDILECRGGFLERFSYLPLPGFLSGFGTAWTTDTLAFKPWPGCAYIDSTVDAVASIAASLGNHRDAPAPELDRIDVDATLLTVQMDALARAGGHFNPLSPVSLNFSIPGNVALTWAAGRLDVDDLRRESLDERAERIVPIARLVHLRHDPALTARMLVTFDAVLDLRSIFAQAPLPALARALARMRRDHPPTESTSAARGHGAVSSLRGALSSIQALDVLRSRSRRRGPRPFDLGNCDLARLEMPFSARVTVQLRDGRRLSHEQRIPRGAPGRPDQETQEVVIDKCVRECTPALGAAAAGRLADMVFDDRTSAGALVGAACLDSSFKPQHRPSW